MGMFAALGGATAGVGEGMYQDRLRQEKMQQDQVEEFRKRLHGMMASPNVHPSAKMALDTYLNRINSAKNLREAFKTVSDIQKEIQVHKQITDAEVQKQQASQGNLPQPLAPPPSMTPQGAKPAVQQPIQPETTGQGIYKEYTPSGMGQMAGQADVEKLKPFLDLLQQRGLQPPPSISGQVRPRILSKGVLGQQLLDADPNITTLAGEPINPSSRYDTAAVGNQIYATPSGIGTKVPTWEIVKGESGITVGVRNTSEGSIYYSQDENIPLEGKKLLDSALAADDKAFSRKEILQAKTQAYALARMQAMLDENQRLTPTEAGALGVSYGTTRREAFGKTVLTADMRNKEAARSRLIPAINQIEALGKRVITEKLAVVQKAKSAGRSIDAALASDPEYRTYQDARLALAGNLAVAQQGSRPSDADIKAIWLPLIPNVFADTIDSARMKWEIIRVTSGLTMAPPPGAGAPKVGTRKTFPNGNVGEWDGTGWRQVGTPK